jgi:Mannosyl-glycoprotein endo-beta-N-acetylglucosaminidase
MIKKVSSGLLVFAGMVSLPGAVSQRQSQVPVHKEVPTPPPTPAATVPGHHDGRLVCLQKFFAQSNCPARQLADIFLQAADDNHLDWRLLPSLSYVETGGGKVAYNNNLFGWASGRAHFDSLAAGIHQVGFQLAHRPPYRHKNTAQILAIYNSSPDYARKVTSVMRQIAPTE